MRWPLAVPALCACALGACRQPATPFAALAPPCPAPAAERAGWRAVDRTAFRFELPAAYRAVPVRGTDSWVGLYAPPDRSETVSFDYGQHSNPLQADPYAVREYRSCGEVIGGRPALVVTYRVHNPQYPEQHGWYAAAATWRDLSAGVHLTIYAEARAAAAVPRLLAVLRTVRFRADTAAGR